MAGCMWATTNPVEDARSDLVLILMLKKRSWLSQYQLRGQGGGLGLWATT